MSMRDLFRRVAQSAQNEAKRLGKSIVLEMVGADELVDRKILESLVSPCVHVARNCVAHGIESESVRVSKGKKPQGLIRLSAKREAGRLLISITDDGQGIDLARVTARGVELGLVGREAAATLSREDALQLLLVHGFSTSEGFDEVSGSGVGLDAALADVQRMGGSIALESDDSEGFCVRIRTPIDPFGFARVVRVRAGGRHYVFSAADVARIDSGGSASARTHLAECIDGRKMDAEPPGATAKAGIGKYRLELGFDTERVYILVDEVDEIASVVIRPISSLVARLGPFVGAVTNDEGAVTFVLDALAVALRARARLAESSR
jgi:two-component system, chemotaxis family, sensor kinase CheA